MLVVFLATSAHRTGPLRMQAARSAAAATVPIQDDRSWSPLERNAQLAAPLDSASALAPPGSARAARLASNSRLVSSAVSGRAAHPASTAATDAGPPIKVSGYGMSLSGYGMVQPLTKPLLENDARAFVNGVVQPLGDSARPAAPEGPEEPEVPTGSSLVDGAPTHQPLSPQTRLRPNRAGRLLQPGGGSVTHQPPLGSARAASIAAEAERAAAGRAERAAVAAASNHLLQPAGGAVTHQPSLGSMRAARIAAEAVRGAEMRAEAKEAAEAVEAEERAAAELRAGAATLEGPASRGEVSRLAEVIGRVEATVAVVAKAREAVAVRHGATGMANTAASGMASGMASGGWLELEGAEGVAKATATALEEAATAHAQAATALAHGATAHAQAATAHALALRHVQARRAALSEFSR